MSFNPMRIIQKHNPEVLEKKSRPADIGSPVQAIKPIHIEQAIDAFCKFGFQNTKSKAGGAYGEYIQLTDRIGAKVLREGIFSSKEAALNSSAWTNACIEAQTLVWAKETFGDIVPDFVYLGVVEWQTAWRVAFMVQHIPGLMLSDLSEEYDANLLLKDCHAKITERGFTPQDLHMGNAMLVRQNGLNDLYIVDWGIPPIFKGSSKVSFASNVNKCSECKVQNCSKKLT